MALIREKLKFEGLIWKQASIICLKFECCAKLRKTPYSAVSKLGSEQRMSRIFKRTTHYFCCGNIPIKCLQLRRRQGCRGLQRTPESFDLPKIRTKSLKIREKMAPNV